MMINLAQTVNGPELFIGEINYKIQEHTSIDLKGVRYIAELDDLNYDLFKDSKPSQFPEALYLSGPYENNDFPFTFMTFWKVKTLNISLFTSTEYRKWAKPFSINEYYSSLLSQLKLTRYPKNKYKVSLVDDPDFMGLEIETVLKNDITIASFIDEYVQLLSKSSEIVLSNLNVQALTAPITALFSFPEHLSNICQQYLMYFGQFLQDLGILVDTEIHKMSYDVLFAITPKNKDEALNKIRSALELFLSFPIISDRLTNYIPDNFIDDIKFQRLLAMLHHFKSQLQLSDALIKVKDNQITQLTSEIQHHRNLEPVLVESLKKIDIKGDTDNSYSILNDYVRIKEIQSKGVDINLPKIVKDIKKLFEMKFIEK